MFQRRHSFALGALLLWVSLVPLRADAYPKTCRDFVLQQSLSDADYAKLKVVRATKARVIFLNEALVRRDFASLRRSTRAQMESFILNEYAYVSVHANDNAQIQHSGIATNPKDEKVALLPHTYGRAFLLEGKGPLVDLKGGGVTYVKKNKAGQVVIEPKSVQFKRGAHHQDGLLSLRDAGYEITASEALHAAVGTSPAYAEVNPVYFLIDLGAQIYTPVGEEVRAEAAVIEGRRPNIRLYRANPTQAEAARKQFLHRNAKLFWKGLYHGSLNRYNAEWGSYIDYGTFTGLAEHSYRITGLTYVPYGLSDFYGLFGEWSLGQIQGKEAKLSPFVDRSWSLFLANLAVAMGASEDETWAFAAQASALGDKDLYQYLLDIQVNHAEKFRWDPSGQTRSRMHLIESSEFGVRGAENLETAPSSVEIYRAVLRNAARSEKAAPRTEEEYFQLILRSCVSPDLNAARSLAQKLVAVEALVRQKWGSTLATHRVWETLGGARSGENIVRSKVLAELQQTQDRFVHHNELPDWDAYLRLQTIRLDPSLAVVDDTSATQLQQDRLARWLESGRVRSQILRLKTEYVDKTFPVISPTAWSMLDPHYQSL